MTLGPNPETKSRFRLSLPPTLRYPARLVALALVYYAAARLGLRYASIGPSISLIWPPTGIAFAALTLLGSRYWPGVAIGVLRPGSALIQKPLTPDALIHAVRERLKATASRRPSEAGGGPV